jgi:riboflavin kinase/FMN adenylyltransferase
MESFRCDGAGCRLAVVTFEPHPLTVLRPELAPPRLTPPALKQSLLEQAGVDDYVILPPSPDVLGLSAEEFWRILRDDARPAHLVEGSTFNFGKDRRGTIQRLREWSAGTNVSLHVIEGVSTALLDLLIVPVSSSIIRWLLAGGRVRDAAICLGRPYSLQGQVIEGHHRGEKLGVPTANLSCVDQMIPADGVYAGRCAIDGKTYPAAISIGKTPTFGDQKRQVEAHLIGFDGNLYGRTIHLELLDWLRDQMRFPDVERLKEQIARDVAHTSLLRDHDPSCAIATA